MSFTKRKLVATNPANLSIRFNGSAFEKQGGNQFFAYNKAEKVKTGKVYTAEKPLRLVILNNAKQINGGTKNNGKFEGVGSNLFVDYDKHIITLFVKGRAVDEGLYQDIKETISDYGGKVQTVLFCWDRDRNEVVELQLKGALKGMLYKAAKSNGGWDGTPVLSLWCADELTEPEAGQPYHIANFRLEDTDVLSLEETDACIKAETQEVTPYLESCFEKALTPYEPPTDTYADGEESDEDEKEPAPMSKVVDPEESIKADIEEDLPF